MKKILIISADNTGHGHKSISESIKEQIEKISSDTEVEIIDGFLLGGRKTELLAKIYNPLAIHLPAVWKSIYAFGNFAPAFINSITAKRIKNKLLMCIEEIRPDLIFSVHPGFIGSVLNIFQQEGIHIPVIPFIADLDNVSRLWADNRSAYTLCPTEEAKNTMLEAGISDEKLKVFGFPSRERFCVVQPSDPNYGSENEGKISFMLMSGSQGTSQITKIAEILLESLKCHITILAGNNRALKEDLERTLVRQYGENVTVLGFTKEVDKYMQMSDILIIRASPNVLIESVNLCKPVIITGALTGQEEKNPDYAVKYNLGVVCSDPHKLPELINELLADNGRKLKGIYESQKRYRKPEAARNIAEFCLETINNNVSADKY